MQKNHCSILSIAPYRILPATTGGRLNIVLFHDFLGNICQDHVIGTFENGSEEQYSFQMHRIFPGSRRRYLPFYGFQNMVSIGKMYDANYIICEHPYMAVSAIALSKKLNIPWFLHSHNIESERFRTLGKKWWKGLYWLERYAMRKADGVFFITPEDSEWATNNFRLQEEKCHLVPFGTTLNKQPSGKDVARKELADSLGIDPSKPWLYFLGALDYYPNHQAVEFILSEIVPRLDEKGVDYQLLIAGKGLSEPLRQAIYLTNDKVKYIGFVPVLDSFLKACDIMLNPVILGGGIKTKAVEALGYNKIVISTESGAAGLLPGVCGANLSVVVDYDWDAFTDKVIESFEKNPSIPDKFYDTYYWGNIAEKVIAIMQDSAQ